MKVDKGIDDASLFRRYLLGELDESEQEALEGNLMTSDEHFQELLIAEDELVDDFYAGKLSASEEQKYQYRFLITPERRLRHRFGAALRKIVSTAAARELAAPPRDRGLRRALLGTWSVPAAAAALALIAAGVWSILQIQRSPLRLEQTAERVDGPTVAFFLTRGSLRSPQPETEQTVAVPIGVALVELQLDLPTGTRGDHEVTLEDARSHAILAEGTLPARSIEGEWVVVAAVPSELLAPGDYRVVLRAPSAGGEDAVVATYEFRVPRR
jgi:hypothetical protein